MKNKFLARTTAVLLFFAVAFTSSLQAQQPHYRLIDMGTFGGPESKLNSGDDGSFSVSVLNNRGLFAGWAETPQPDPFPAFCFSDDCYVAHAFQWQSGVRSDLGALADGVSSQAIWVSNSGLIAGVSENGAIDPLVSDFPEFRAVLWKNGHITDLGTLPEGGFESFAHAVNSKGQVVGDALNTIADPNSIEAPGLFQTQTRAFLWENGAMQDLGTLGGTDAMAQFINEQGQVVGWSYTGSDPNTSCPGLFPLAMGSFIWDRAHGMRDLGTISGTCTLVLGLNNNGTAIGIYVNDQQFERGFVWQRGKIQDIASLGGDFLGPEAINDQGLVAGWSYLAGNAVNHAALWRGAGNVTDLGVVAGDDCSFASAINAKTQIVGSSQGDGCTFDDNSHAFLWEAGTMYDLNTLIPPGASLHLLFALGINDRGEIAGTGLAADGNRHDFLLVPCVANSASDCQEVIAGEIAITPRPFRVAPKPISNQNSLQRMLRRPLGPGPHFLKSTTKLSGAQSSLATEAGTSLSITSGNPPSGTVGRLYDFRCSQIPLCNVFLAGFPVRAAGGVQPYSWKWAAQSGSTVPPGLMFPDLSRQQCVNVRPPAICGKPTMAGYYNVVITVTDSESPPNHASARYTIHILP